MAAVVVGVLSLAAAGVLEAALSLAALTMTVRVTYTLTKLVNRWPASRIDELMPWAYAKAAPTAVNV